ncbi:MAG: lipopolysaccharide biosynthesis protein [Planctomycetota bacterium]|nr:MAG: lipopolysaccharide biosynthesis protein [Planctomycetota bacterium]
MRKRSVRHFGKRSRRPRGERERGTLTVGDHPFETDHLLPDLRQRSVRGGAIVLVSQACKFLIALGGLMVLARLLTPVDFGLLGMVVAVTGFLMLFKDLGLSMATIQRPDLTHEQVSTLFWINVSLSVGIALLTAGAAPLLAWFYREPRLTGITLVLSGAFVFGGLSVQHLALLRRQMRFGVVAAVEIAAQLLSVLAALIVAWRWRTYWALVAMHVTLPAVTAAGVWIACRWRPGRPVRGCGVRPLLSYGGYQTGFTIVNYITRNLDNALIGWWWGAHALGVYREAYRLLLLPLQQINLPTTHVALATLSRLQHEPERFRAYFVRGIELMTACGMPLVVFLFVCADGVVRTVLGNQWTEAVPIFRVLGPAAFLGTFNVASGWVYAALGRMDRKFRWGVLAATCFTIAFFLALPYGAIGVAAAVSIVTCALRIPGLLYAYHGTPIRMRDLGRAIRRPAAASALAGLVLFAVRAAWEPAWPAPLLLLLHGSICAAFYLIAWRVLPGGREASADLLRLIREMRGGREESKAGE